MHRVWTARQFKSIYEAQFGYDKVGHSQCHERHYREHFSKIEVIYPLTIVCVQKSSSRNSAHHSLGSCEIPASRTHDEAGPF